MLATVVGRRIVALTLIAVLLLATVPVASAQEVRGGGAVTVPAGTVHEGDLALFGGSVLIEGTVDGDVEGLAGSITVVGTVTGDIEAAAGSVTVQGVVDGNVEAAAGSVTVAEGARIGGNLETGTETLTIDGTVDGTVEAGVQTLRVGDSAVIGGDLRYDGETIVIADGATIGGVAERVDRISVGLPGPFVGDVDFGGAFDVLGATFVLAVNVVLGAILLVAAPRFARRVATTGTTDAARSGLAGLATLVGVPVALVVTALTIVGLPLAAVGIGLYLVVLWVGFVYGALVAGTALLGLADRESRWIALLVGLLVPTLAGVVDIGWLIGLAYLLLGLGAFTLSVLAVRRGGDETATMDEVGPRDPEVA
jgi:cytoskeletal protein CcmA (bactofilin family)